MAKVYDKKADPSAVNRITEELAEYIDSIKEDIAYEELDKNVEKDEIIKQLIQYYTNNPLDDTMSYDDWVEEFIDSNDLRENAYKSQIKDYLRNIVIIIYSNISRVEDPDAKVDAFNLRPSKYVFTEYINIEDDASLNRMSVSENGSILHHLTNVPASLGKSFKCRDILLVRAEEKLASCSRLYLETTLSGTGRKAFARELYNKICMNYTNSAWIRLDSTLRQSILESMTIYPATNDIEIRYSQILAFLKAKKRKLLFFIDNTYGFNITEEEYAFLAQFNVDVLFINDPQVTSVRLEGFKVSRLSMEQSIDIFYEYYSLDKAHKFINVVEEFVDLADRNTFLIKLLAKATKGYNLSDFLHRIKTDGFSHHNLAEVNNDTAVNFMARNAIKLIKTENLSDAQYDILKNFAVMPEIDIPSSITDALGFAKSDLEVLAAFGLIDAFEKANYGMVYYMHPIMRVAINMQFDIKTVDVKKLLNLVISPDFTKKTDSYALFLTKLRISKGILDSLSGQHFEEKGELYNAVACRYYECGEYDRALELEKKVVNIREKIPVINHPSTAIVYDNISRIYSAVDDYDNAIEFGKKALAIYEAYNDTYSAKIASICTVIGAALNEKGDYDNAIEYLNRALEIREKEGQSLSLANVYSKLGAVHNEMKDVDLAIEFHTKAMKIKEKLLGTDSPATSMSYNSLALIYKEQGDFDKALEFNNKALKIRERILGTEHPLTARTYNHLGRIYLNKEEYDKSVDYYVKAYKILKHIYGDTNSMTRLIKENLESAYRRRFDKWLNDQLK